MYKILDLTDNRVVATAETKLGLLSAWNTVTLTLTMRDRKQRGLDFIELNITGNDLRPESLVCRSVGLWSALIPRRYQVRDAFDRSVDISTWDKEIKQYEAGIRFATKNKKEYSLLTAKPHRQRCSSRRPQVCWKDVSKSARQWAKHERGCSGKNFRNAHADFAELSGFPCAGSNPIDLALVTAELKNETC